VLEKLQDRISEATVRQRSFALRLSKAGVFPSNTRPRILWIGTDDSSGAVEPLYEQIETECHGLGFEREGRQFHPHITIGRVREARGAAGLANAHLETKIEPVQFEVADVVIYESKLQPTGSIYSVVSRAALGAQL
jgi:2'-5' RNA ligase